MNKKANNVNLSGWSGVAVAIGIAGFMAFTGHAGWAWFFGILGIIIAVIPHL